LPKKYLYSPKDKNGYDGNDSLNGDSGNDSLYGQAGNDTLNPGLGLNEKVDGGTGIDLLNIDYIKNYKRQ